MRVALHSMGIPIDDDWTIREVVVRREIRTEEEPDVDVYGNKYENVVVTGQHVTVSVYRPEN